MQRWIPALLILVVAGLLSPCGRPRGGVIVDGQPLVDALCDGWTRCAPELGPLGATADCAAALTGCAPVAFANPQVDLEACVAAIGQATCFDLAETPFSADPVVDRFNDGRRGGELLLAWLQRRFGVCGELWVARPEDAPQAGQSCTAQPCGDPHTSCDRARRVCIAQGGVGAPCAAAVNAGADCRQGLTCDAARGECRLWPLGAPGEDCSTDAGCSTALCAERQGSVKCRLKVEAGGFCDRDDVCYGHRVCRGNRCADRGGADTACADDGQCLLGHTCEELGDGRRCVVRALCP